MTGQQIIILSLFAIAFMAVAMLVLMTVWYIRNEQKERQRLTQTKADIADMTILFQTMRDIMNQQKGLAREFNKEIEKKMGLVRQILAASMEKNERLYEKQQTLVRELAESRAHLESLQRQMTYLEETQSRSALAPGPAAQVVVPPLQPVPRPTAPVEEQPFSPAPPLAASGDSPAFVTQEEALGDSALKAWLDDDSSFAFSAPEPIQDDYEERDPAPDDADSARAAFRSLLNMGTPTSNPPASVIESDAPRVEASSGSNGSRNSPLLQRVLEYSLAGMSVADIATELGVGKGEVRLMLSLARQRQP
ncbi:MAG: hypothetical protein HYZ00_09215 [Candidatus Hydrogenedentes bacterium]|nr:hypothetical protein [Candidatus Hydrogenedentota bacterium]